MTAALDHCLRAFLAEDQGVGDVTSIALVPEQCRAVGEFRSKEAGVVSGLDVAERLFSLCSPGARWEAQVADGTTVASGVLLARVEGAARDLLLAERTALNLLQRMSGIASLTAQFVAAAEGTQAAILDTRKTAPGLRWFDKRAVRDGGGQNHRTGLYDQVLIKENHLAMMPAADAEGRRPLAAAIAQARGAHPELIIEIEVLTVDEARVAAIAGADIVLLDNMEPAAVAEAVAQVRRASPGVAVEASGGIHLQNVAAYAATGVDRISLGALTHSAKALDISLLIHQV